jgi:hypothetical protein
VTRQVSEAGRTKLAIAPTGAFARGLEHRATRSNIRIAFTARDGVTLVKHVRIRLARRSPLAR